MLKKNLILMKTKKKKTHQKLMNITITVQVTSKIQKKYFQREVRHLYDVQIEGYPFLRFIGFNYRTVDSSPFIITEYMKGKTLSKLIENQFNEIESPSTTKMIIFYGVAFALKILHSMKIIHRDIKPENIFLNEEKEPFLGDFGFARYIQESTKLTEKTGTTYYKPVELFDNENPPKPSDKIDSYSFAVTVLETLTYDLKIFDKKKNKFLSKNSKNDEDVDDYLETWKEYIKNGGKYVIPDDVPNNYKMLINECFSEADERPSMQMIFEMMDNGELNLPDLDEEKFNEYKNGLKKAELNPKRRQRKKKKTNIKKFKPKTTPL